MTKLITIVQMINMPRRNNDANLRNSACRALIVLTDSSPELKLALLNHEATRDVLLQQLSSFDDDLKGAWGCNHVAVEPFPTHKHVMRSCCNDLTCNLYLWKHAEYQSDCRHTCFVDEHLCLHC